MLVRWAKVNEGRIIGRRPKVGTSGYGVAYLMLYQYFDEKAKSLDLTSDTEIVS